MKSQDNCSDHLILVNVVRWQQRIVHRSLMFGGCSAVEDVFRWKFMTSWKTSGDLLYCTGMCAVLGAEVMLLFFFLSYCVDVILSMLLNLINLLHFEACWIELYDRLLCGLLLWFGNRNSVHVLFLLVKRCRTPVPSSCTHLKTNQSAKVGCGPVRVGGSWGVALC